MKMLSLKIAAVALGLAVPMAGVAYATPLSPVTKTIALSNDEGQIVQANHKKWRKHKQWNRYNHRHRYGWRHRHRHHYGYYGGPGFSFGFGPRPYYGGYYGYGGPSFGFYIN